MHSNLISEGKDKARKVTNGQLPLVTTGTQTNTDCEVPTVQEVVRQKSMEKHNVQVSPKNLNEGPAKWPKKLGNNG